MMEIQVYLRRPTVHGRLYPRYDDEADLLVVSRALLEPCPYGIDVDGTLVFDLDADHVLANFELLVPKRLWHVVSTSEAPRPSREAEIVFSQSSVIQKSFHLPLEVRTNELQSYADIRIGRSEKEAIWVALSGSCFALLTRDRLKGFFVSLK
jgi:hypothetical protein